jgi:peptidoglycan/LPS O-acetylase OafA/YrhL
MKIQWLDTLRVFGLALILIYHLAPKASPVLSGGFIGVEIFFVISGYLTTALILSSLNNTSSFKLGKFFQKRVKRLIPPLIFMMVIIIPLMLLISSDFRAGLLAQILAVLGQFTNIYEILINGSYGATLLPHIFIHTWTLSMEFQYYILWAALIFVLTKLIHNPKILRITLIVISGIITISSMILMSVDSNALIDSKNFSPVYFSTFTHIFPLMFGSFIGALFQMPNTKMKVNSKLWLMLPPLGVLGIFYISTITEFNSINPFHIGLILVTLLTGITIIGILISQVHLKSEPKIMTYLSNRSYAIYLFHYPLNVIFVALFSNSFYDFNPWLISLLVLELTFILANFSYKFIEKSFKKKSIILVIVLAIISCTIVVTSPTKNSIDLQLETQTKLNEEYNQKNFESTPEDTSVSDEDTSVSNKSTRKSYKKMTKWEKIANSPAIIVGDSVTNITSGFLRETIKGAYIDPMGNRRMCQGKTVLEKLDSHNALSKVIVMALGENILSNDPPCAIDIINNYSPNHHIIFVTGFGLGYKEMADFADKMREWPTKYINVTIADWAKAIKPISKKPGVMSQDGFHPESGKAKQLYADTIKAAIDEIPY